MNDFDDCLHVFYTLPKIRERASMVYDYVNSHQASYFWLDERKLPTLAKEVIAYMDKQYPNGEVPYHSRFRHIEMDNINRLAVLRDALSLGDKEWVNCVFEWLILSVFLDAGAGSTWRFYDTIVGKYYQRSEGLALASLALMGYFYHPNHDKVGVSTALIERLSEKEFEDIYQVTEDNPLVGTTGRYALLQSIGALLTHHRLSRLADFLNKLTRRMPNKVCFVDSLFNQLVKFFSPIWAITYPELPHLVGDIGVYPFIKSTEKMSDWVPFHKLTQWLTYSLIEWFEQSGYTIESSSLLTGLPEYRNGGLFVDSGVMGLNNAQNKNQYHFPTSPLVVEWRALTIVLLDKLATEIGGMMTLPEDVLPLSKILQGGTWSLGREKAYQRSPTGQSPILIKSDGNIF
jgi:hypothetical protein